MIVLVSRILPMKYRKLSANSGATTRTTTASRQSLESKSAAMATVVPRSVRIVKVWPVTNTWIAPTSSITRERIAPLGVLS